MIFIRHQDPPILSIGIEQCTHSYYNCLVFNGCHEYTCAYIDRADTFREYQLTLLCIIVALLTLSLHPM